MATSVNYISWEKDVWPVLEKQFKTFSREGVKPTVRGLLYILESMEVLKKKDYNSLSKHLTKWRERGFLPSDCVVDKTRRILNIVTKYAKYAKYSIRILIDFDESIHKVALEEVKRLYPASDIHEQLKQMVEALLDDLKGRDMEYEI